MRRARFCANLGTFLELGEAAVTLRLISPLTIAMLGIGAGHALAQGGGPSAPPVEVQAKEPASPTVNGSPPERCMKRDLRALYWEWVQRSMLVKSLAEAEVGSIRYVESHPAGCGLPQNQADLMMAGHDRTMSLQTQVCTAAQQIHRPGLGAPTPSDLVGRLASLPVGPMGDF
jgi:hypothetical protein